MNRRCSRGCAFDFGVTEWRRAGHVAVDRRLVHMGSTKDMLAVRIDDVA